MQDFPKLMILVIVVMMKRIQMTKNQQFLTFGVVDLGSERRQMSNVVAYYFILIFYSMTSGVLCLFTIPPTSSNSSSYQLGYLTKL